MKRIIFTLLLASLCLTNFSCVKEKPFQFPFFQGMGTLIKTSAVLKNQNPYEILQKIQALVKELENRLSRYLPNSEVSEFNRFPLNKEFIASPTMYELISISLRIHRDTKVFDITLLPVIKIWDYKKGLIPTESAIREAAHKTGSEFLELLPDSKIIKKKLLEIDLGAIAKGYTAKKIAELLIKEGVSKAVIQVGGEVYAFGGEYRVGIVNPKDKKPIYSFIVQDKGISTSGDYERFFNKNGIIYSHIIDPRSMRPATVTAHSVSVIGPDSTFTDALSTSFFILGPEKSFEILKKYSGYSAVFILPDRSVIKSPFFPYPMDEIK